VDALGAAVRAEGIPAAVSRDAGGFLCNHVFYELMHLIATERPGLRGGFVHVPLLPEQAVDDDLPTVPIETLERAVRAMIAALAAE
jgi:pyroglutamyl-peptidase